MPPPLARTWWTIVGPIAALFVFAATLALVAWLLGWYPSEMFVVAVGLLSAVAVVAALLLLRQGRGELAAEAALRNVETRVAGIVDSAMDAIVTVDETQRVVFFNPAAERMFGWPRDAVIGQPLERLIPERFRSDHRRHIERFSATGTTSRRMGGLSALLALHANGAEFPIDASISQHVESGRRFYTAMLRDITARVRAETLLARSETRLRGIVDSAMDAIITVDQDQHVVMFNAAAESMFGWSQTEALGAPLALFIPDRFRDVHAKHVTDFGRTGVGSRRMGGARVVTGLRRKGEEFPIDASISQHSDGTAKFFTVILRDVTERMLAERALQTSKEELQALAAAAHQTRESEQHRIARELHDELGQGLTALQMMVVWVSDRIGNGDSELAARLARMTKVLNETVVATRRISSELRPLILDDLGLFPALESMVEQFSERTGIECELSASDPSLELSAAHQTAVFRIVQESLTNIAKHARAARAELSVRHDSDEIEIDIADDGIGFDPDAPRAQGSRGLLGIRERAYLLGGQVDVASAPGKGTRVTVRLPLAVGVPVS